MPHLIVVARDGSRHVLERTEGASVMEMIRDAGIDELQALCGGSCSCATCHVYVECGPVSSAAVSPDEDDLLDCSSFRTEKSRLSCQLAMSSDGTNLKVTIAPED